MELIEDLRANNIARMFEVQPWEAGDIPEYWIERRSLFNRVSQQVDEHNARKRR